MPAMALLCGMGASAALADVTATFTEAPSSGATSNGRARLHTVIEVASDGSARIEMGNGAPIDDGYTLIRDGKIYRVSPGPGGPVAVSAEADAYNYRQSVRRGEIILSSGNQQQPRPSSLVAKGLLVWVSSSSSAGGTPPYLSPYFAAKAAMDALAVQYARELARWGIETSIIVPGAFTKGTNHFAHSGRPADEVRLAEYEAGPYKGFGDQVQEAFAAIVPDDADVTGVADAIVEVVDMPFGQRPFRVHYDPTEDGANIGFGVLDRLRAEMLHRVGLSDLLKPAKLV